MQFARINGNTLHFQEIGGPEGAKALVFVNSIGSDFRIWRDVAVRLAGQFRIVLYDMRGHGLSDVGETPYAIDTHADDLAALLDHIGLKRAVIVGLSVGGQVALALSARRSDLIEALVLCDTGHKIGTEESWTARIQTVQSYGVARIADTVLSVWFTPRFLESHPEEVAGYRNMVARQSAEGYVGICAALRDADLTDLARGVAAPTLCLAGADDPSTPPALLKELAELIPGAEFAEIANAAHMPQIEQPGPFVELLTGFVRNLPKKDGAHG
jgi:3-oxoadipate enol-lactonase